MLYLAGDMHRAWPKPGVFLAAVLVTAIAVPRLAKRRGRDSAAPCLFYAATVLAWTLAAGTARAWGPDWLTLALLRPMPYRLLNHLPLIALALAVAEFAGAPGRSRRLATLLVAAMLYAVCYPWAAASIPESFRPYLAPSAGLLYALAGCGSVAAWLRRKTRGSVAAGATTAVVLLIAPFHQFGAACLAVGAAAGWWAVRSRANDPPWPRRLVYAAAAVCLVPLAASQLLQFDVLPVPPDRVAAAEALDSAAQTGARTFVLNPPEAEFRLLAHLGHGTMTDVTLTTSSVQYMPQLAGPLERMWTELYADWTRDWPRWTPAQWHAKARRFGFTHVWSPVPIPALTPVVPGDHHTLYRLP